MPSLILNTCGTSLLTNGRISDDLRPLINKHSNHQQKDIIASDFAQLQQHVTQRQQDLLAADTTLARKMSAELNSLLSWQAEHEPKQQDVYILLATDTYLGQNTAESIGQWLQQRGFMTQILNTSGLNTAKLLGFRQALSGLVKQLHELLTGYKDKGYSVYFNLTGGFKSLNGFLQALSGLYADQAFYLFEGSSELLYIPKLPLRLDADNIIQENIRTFSRLAHDLTVSESEWKKIPDTLLFQIDDQITLSEWGELLWQSSYKDLYQQKLLPSVSERVIYTNDFEVSTKDLLPHLLQIVNERIVDLAVYAEGDCKSALKSLDPKPLQEKKYKVQNIWECDLDAHHRIFMTKQGHTFLLEKVTKSLH